MHVQVLCYRGDAVPPFVQITMPRAPRSSSDRALDSHVVQYDAINSREGACITKRTIKQCVAEHVAECVQNQTSAPDAIELTVVVDACVRSIFVKLVHST